MDEVSKTKTIKSGRPKTMKGDAEKRSIYLSEVDKAKVFKEMEKLNLKFSEFYRFMTKLYFEEIKTNNSLDALRDKAMNKHYFL